MRRQKGRKGRLGAWVLALAMVVPCFGAFSALSEAVVPQQTTAQAAEDYSVIRVGITLNGTQTSVPFVLSGKYKLVENAGIALPNGNYTVSASGNTLTIKTPTASYKIGSKITLSEDTTAGVNLISIHTKWNEKDNPSDRLSYRGDIVFYAENGAVKVMNRVSMETYTLGVIKGEMGSGFRLEALKAQCVAARSYAIYKMKRSNKVNYDIGDSSTEQVYRGYSSAAILQQAVNETKGQVLTYNGSIIEAMYSAVNGGQTDVPNGNTSFPYFKIRDDSYDLTFKGNEQLLFVPTNIVGTRYDANVHATQVKCTGKNVRIRTEPSTAGGNATVIGSAQPGDVFTLLETQNGWYKIKYNGRDAYISAEYSEKVLSGTETVSLPYEYDQLHMQDLQKLAYEYLKAKGYNVPTQTNVRLLRCNYLKGKEKFYPNLASRCYKTGEASLKVQYVDGEGKLHDNIDNVVVTVLLQKSVSNREHAYFNQNYRMRGAEAGTESGISGYYWTNRRYGHGVGLSQRGADARAKAGHTYKQILDFYYPGAAISTVNTDVTSLKINTITVDPLQAKDTFNVTANVSGAKNVSFAVWGDVNGQNDLYWHQGINQGNGSWTCTVDWTEHGKETGTYSVVAYAEGNAGNLISKEVAAKPTVLGAEKLAIHTVTASPLDAKDTFTATANVSGAKNVSFAVWSDVNGQNDLYWHQGINQGNGNWTCTVDWTKHGKETGTYSVVAYAEDNAGNLINKEVAAKPTVSGVEKLAIHTVTASPLQAKDTFTATANVSGAKNVAFTIWGDANGQNDLYWHQGINQGNGNWTCTVDWTKHGKETGTYSVVAYAEDNAGNLISKEVAAKPTVSGTTGLAIHTVTASPLDAKDTFNVTANVSGAKNVAFTIWGDANGQNDLYWYQGINQGNGNWTCTVDWTKHGKETGTYSVVAYAEDNAGNLISKEVAAKPTVSGTTGLAIHTVTASPLDAKDTFNVTANVSGAKNVSFAVWSDVNGQNDLYWHQGINQGNGNWTCTVDWTKHGKETGTYSVVAYAEDNAGNLINKEVAAKPTVSGTTGLAIHTVTASPLDAKVVFTATANVSGAKNVAFTIWGDANGQNDLYWYQGINQGDGNWTCTVDWTKHGKETGTYSVVAYAEDNAGNLISKEVTAKPTLTGQAQGIATIKATDLNVRSGPGTTYDVLGQANRPESYTMYEEVKNEAGESWLVIDYKGRIGYIKNQTSYVEVKKTT